MLGELVPVGGGDPIPLLKKNLLVGRRESCDIVLRFSNVSAHHCQFTCNGGYWYVKDLKSRNGVKVNGSRVSVKSGSIRATSWSIAKHSYDVRYSPYDLGASGPPPVDDQTADVMKQSLLGARRAGGSREKSATAATKEPKTSGRFDILDDSGPDQGSQQARLT